MSYINELRDKIAIAVLGSMISNERIKEDYLHSPDALCSIAYSMADAMLRARQIKL